MHDHDQSDPLAFAVAVFDRWRAERASAGAHVPPPLRQIACRLLEFESRAHVARSLQILPATLGRWQARDDGQRRSAARAAADDASPPSEFVSLPPSDERALATPTPPNTPPPFASLVIERTDGVRLHLGGPIDIAAVIALVGTGAFR